MKKINFLIVLLAMTFASCSVSNDVVDGGFIQKRKYNKGFHFSKKTQLKLTPPESNENTVLNNKIITKDKTINTTVKSSSVDTKKTLSPTENAVKEEIPTDVAFVSTTVAKDKVNSHTKSPLVNNTISYKGKRSAQKSMGKLKNRRVFGIAQKTDGIADSQELRASDVLLIILAILIPFLAVGIYDGITNRFWISLLLSILFWLPGIIYALLVVTGTI